MKLQPVASEERDVLLAMLLRYWEGLMPNARMVRDPVRRQGIHEDRAVPATVMVGWPRGL